jgi:lantibiotic modifying enzyme
MTSVSTSPQTWSPILEGSEAAQAVAAVSAVAEAIGEAPLPARNGVHLGAGEVGAALFFAYLDRARPGAGYGEIALHRLERAIDTLASFPQSPDLYSGFTGVAWVAEHLQGSSVEEEDPNEDIDAALLRLLCQTPWTRQYDLITGLVGYAVYALERLPRPSAVACLELVVERLAEIAQPRPGGLAWYTPREMLPEPNRPWFPQGWENLGVAHGTPGVIAVLARICASGVAVEQARPLLEGAVSWLLAQKLPEGERSVFPYMVGREVKIRPARTAWCYGDPGIAAALLAAGRAAGRPTWEHEALALARVVARRPTESCGVNDAGLCHGAAGLGHLLNRLYQATGDPELLAAARAWFGRALGYWEPGRGIGGFLALTPPDDDFDRLEWNEEPGFLNGSAGVALALLAATSGVDPVWDRVLLTSPLPAKSALEEV